jgi:hypothetical protein
MAPTVPTVDDMITSFPHPTLPRVSAEGNYNELVELRNCLKETFCSVYTIRCGGEYGHLGDILSDTMYATIAPNSPYIVPPNVGPQPVIEAGTNTINKENLLRAYDELKRENIEYKNLESAAKKQMTDVIPSGLLSGIKCPHRGFQNVRARAMLQHCFDECPIDSHMIMENETRLTADWDANRPFANLIQRATAVHEFANDAGRTITDNKVMDALYTVIFNTGVMCEECEKWEDKATAEKTYADFKTHFTTAQRKLKRRQKTTARQGRGFHGVNAVVAEQLE